MLSRITMFFCVAALLVSSNPAEAHDIYSRLVDKWGAPCCNETDCRPARFRVTPKGVECSWPEGGPVFRTKAFNSEASRAMLARRVAVTGVAKRTGDTTRLVVRNSTG